MLRSGREGAAAMGSRWFILGVLFVARTAIGFQFQSVASTAPFCSVSTSGPYRRADTASVSISASASVEPTSASQARLRQPNARSMRARR